MLQLYPVCLLWNRRKTLTGSLDPTRVNGTNKPCMVLDIKMDKQECIPVGCVPSTAAAVSTVMHMPPAMHPPTMHTPFTTHAPSQTGPLHPTCSPLPHMPPFAMHAPLCHTHPPLPMHAPLCHTPMDRMTDTCENITFPQLLLRTVKYIPKNCYRLVWTSGVPKVHSSTLILTCLWTSKRLLTKSLKWGKNSSTRTHSR